VNIVHNEYEKVASWREKKW